MKWVLSGFVLLFGLGLIGCTQADKNKSSEEKPIGVAEMASDGTITLHLIAEGNSNNVPIRGESMSVYKTNDPEYKKILKHLGEMHPGESKAVKPWGGDKQTSQ